jgi:hypothetical protein
MASINLDVAQRLDITCRKRDTFKLTINFADSSGTAIDLSGYNFKMDVRDATNSTDIIADTLIVPTTNAGGVLGKLELDITDSNMNVTAGTYIYDLQATLSGTVTTWMYGIFTINDDVTF